MSHIAITSRWKCIVAFGSPVVPDVNASMQTSSRAVGTFANVAGRVAQSASSVGRPSASLALKRRTRINPDA